MSDKNFSSAFCESLRLANYTHCFYVAGGNIMHLLNAARNNFICVPVIHEVAAVIAAEYFNDSSRNQKAFALVTAGPGITNCITGIAGAWLESREVLVVGGQVKSSDLKSEGMRQRGIQEIDGVSICAPITKLSIRIEGPINTSEVMSLIRVAGENRPGPVFLEICLDAQAAPAMLTTDDGQALKDDFGFQRQLSASELQAMKQLVLNSTRPVILIGGGVKREIIAEILPILEKANVPIMTTWNAADRIAYKHPLYWGRPNTWGQRSANVLIQQADLLISIGSRLGLQQTGFNWQEFVPFGKIIQVDIDELELDKGHPKIDLGIKSDSANFFEQFVEILGEKPFNQTRDWIDFGKFVRQALPLSENVNLTREGYINPYHFITGLSEILPSECVIVPCSSGGAFTTFMQAFNQKFGQVIQTDKGLASMGYGLSGAIGASFSNTGKPVILIEGDGGFAQNLQELGTVKANALPIKIFIYDNSGYASIRMTQKNYFGGEYIGCDKQTGLGLPDWTLIFATYGISCSIFKFEDFESQEFQAQIIDDQPRAFIVRIDPEQTYYPKISSNVLPDGGMISAPLHDMTPSLSPEIESLVLKFLN